MSLVVHPSQRNSRLEAAVKQRQLNGFAHSDQLESRGTQPQSECASLAADHLRLAAQLLSLGIHVENGGLHRRSCRFGQTGGIRSRAPGRQTTCAVHGAELSRGAIRIPATLSIRSTEATTLPAINSKPCEKRAFPPFLKALPKYTN